LRCHFLNTVGLFVVPKRHRTCQFITIHQLPSSELETREADAYTCAWLYNSYTSFTIKAVLLNLQRPEVRWKSILNDEHIIGFLHSTAEHN